MTNDNNGERRQDIRVKKDSRGKSTHPVVVDVIVAEEVTYDTRTPYITFAFAFVCTFAFAFALLCFGSCPYFCSYYHSIFHVVFFFFFNVLIFWILHLIVCNVYTLAYFITPLIWFYKRTSRSIVSEYGEHNLWKYQTLNLTLLISSSMTWSQEARREKSMAILLYFSFLHFSSSPLNMRHKQF